MEKLDCGKKALKKFGITMGVAFLVISLAVLFRHRHSPLPWAGLSAVFFLSGFIAPQSLKLVYIAWMRLAFVLGWINTRIILALIFYFILTPIGIVMRLSGKDFLDRKLEKARESYWQAQPEKAFSKVDYERQF